MFVDSVTVIIGSAARRSFRMKFLDHKIVTLTVDFGAVSQMSFGVFGHLSSTDTSLIKR